MDAQLLCEIEPSVLVEHLAGGRTTLVGRGTVTLSILSILPSIPNSLDAPTYLDVKSPPPIPPRPISLVPPPLPPRVSSSAPSLALPLPRRPTTPTPPLIPAASQLDLWLVLQLSSPSGEPIFECPIPSSSFAVVTIPPASYLFPCIVPSYDMLFGGVIEKRKEGGGKEEDDDGAGFIKITLPHLGVATEDRETFEEALAYLSSDRHDTTELRSNLVLVDEESGAVLGTLATDVTISEDTAFTLDTATEKEPVVVEGVSSSSPSGGTVTVKPVSAWRALENPTGSKLIRMADLVSWGVIVGAEAISRGVQSSAAKFVEGSKATENPVVFSATTKTLVSTGHKATSGAVRISSKTVEIIGDITASFGDKLGKTLKMQTNSSGKAPNGIRGVVNRSLVAFNAVADSISIGGTSLIEAGTSSSTAVVSHKFGSEAAGLATQVGGGVKHVALVYIDARGVTRKAMLKSVGKHAIKARMTDGREVVWSGNSLQPTAPSLPPRKDEKMA